MRKWTFLVVMVVTIIFLVECYRGHLVSLLRHFAVNIARRL
ncbi:hypothetical protein [Pantoea ananatis]|nr:hypothetical protein [Pantoea ananatis]